MKRAVALALVGLCLLSSFLFFPQAAQGRIVDECFSNWNRCRVNAFNMDVSWVRMTLVMTVCDIGFGRCILYF
jgi:hypothetical protein